MLKWLVMAERIPPLPPETPFDAASIFDREAVISDHNNLAHTLGSLGNKRVPNTYCLRIIYHPEGLYFAAFASVPAALPDFPRLLLLLKNRSVKINYHFGTADMTVYNLYRSLHWVSAPDVPGLTPRPCTDPQFLAFLEVNRFRPQPNTSKDWRF